MPSRIRILRPMRWIVLLLVCFLVACGEEKGEKPLTVGMDLSYPPFEMIDASGKPTGLSVDIAQALAADLGRPLKIENIPFVGLIPSLQSGKIDCVISSMTATEERSQSIAFSEPYLKTGLALLAGKDSSLTGLADLDSPERTVVVRQGTTGEVWARNTLKQARILAVEKESSAVLEVIQGKADAFIYDQMSVWQNGQKHEGKVRPLLTPIREEMWAIGIRQDQTALRDQINQFLFRFREQGGFEKLGDKYLGEQKASFKEQGIPFVF